MPNWSVAFDDTFDTEWQTWPREAQDELLARAKLLEELGPALRRPHADALKGSKFANMKELRFSHGNDVWRVAFAFDPTRKAVLLVAGNKVGADQRLFYKRLIDNADTRLTQHLLPMKSELKTISTDLKEKQRGKKT